MRSSLLVLTLVSAAVAQFVAPATAQTSQGGSYKIPKGQLGDGSKIIPSRPKIDIMDESPIVKDRRKVDDQPTYEIVIPPLPNSAGSQGGGNSGSPTRPGVVRITPTRDGRILAPPGMESHIPAQGVATPRDLPSGTSTGVHTRMTTPQNTSGETVARKHGTLLGTPPAHHTSPPVTATYAPSASSQGSSGNRTTTDVKATKLQERGRLLK